MRRVLVAITMAVLLAGCDVKSRTVPIEDAAQLRAIALSLSPWADGSPDTSQDGKTPGEEGSDRKLFARWVLSYVYTLNERQYAKGYRPRSMPTVGEAIEEQRAADAKQKGDEDARRAQMHKEERAAADRRQRQAEADARAADERQAQYEADQAQREAQYDADLEAEAARDDARQDCIDKRQNAALSADPADYQRVWNSFPACERMP